MDDDTIPPCFEAAAASYQFNLEMDDRTADELESDASDSINAGDGFKILSGQKMKIVAVKGLSTDPHIGPENQVQVLNGAHAGSQCGGVLDILSK